MIFILGDSHVSFLSGRDQVAPSWEEPARKDWDNNPHFRTWRVGPWLSRDIGDPTSEAHRILMLAHREVEPGCRLMLLFGEVDTRSTIPRRAALERRSIEDVAREHVESYSRTWVEMRSLGHEVIIFGGIPSAVAFDGPTDGDMFTPYGSNLGRMEASRQFDRLVKEKTRELGFQCCSIHDELIAAHGQAIGSYYSDGIHLNLKAAGLVLDKLGIPR